MESNPRLMYCGHVPPQTNWGTARSKHDFHEIIVVFRGHLTVVFDSETIEATTGDILFYKAGRFHTEQSDPTNPVETRFLSLLCDTLNDWNWTRLVDRDGRVRELASWLERDWHSLDPSAQFTRLAILQTIVAECQRLSSHQEEPFLATVHQFMDANLGKVLTNADLAETVKLSPFHFNRRYRRLTGHPPMTELRRRRMETARHLLVTTDLSISAIAKIIGLVSVQHLARLFRQQFGVTPGEIHRTLYRPVESHPDSSSFRVGNK